MRNHDKLLMILLVLMSVVLASCAVTRAPSHRLPEPEEMATSPFGSWIEIETGQGDFTGELLAVSPDTLFMADTAFRGIAIVDIRSARLVTYRATTLGHFVLLGTLSTISNGWVLIVTAPMWLVGGIIAMVARSFEPIIDYPDEPLERFVPFARFPQGLPEGMNRITAGRK